jgi:outer membrane protein, multidrug efflux system
VTQPIFKGGRLRSEVRLAEARQQTAVLFYQQSIQGAFRSVSDALVAYHKTREFLAQQELLFRPVQNAARLSHMRYTGCGRVKPQGNRLAWTREPAWEP